MRRSSYLFPLRWPDGVRDASRKRDAQRRFFEASLTAGRPSAFTLLELLVVVAIMGVLLALLLAAVQRSARNGGPRSVLEQSAATRPGHARLP